MKVFGVETIHLPLVSLNFDSLRKQLLDDRKLKDNVD